MLSRDPDSISVYEVLSRLEGKLEVVAESRHGGVLDFYWDEIQRALMAQLDRTLGDLMRERTQKDRQVDYVI
jgi:DNA-binding IscR family transcriptional regulator